MNDLLEKRERQARRLLRVCLRPISTECIQRYVDAYEAGTLEHGAPQLCALGAMSDGCWAKWAFGPHPHHRESLHIENIFEGYPLFDCRPLGDLFHADSWSDGSEDSDPDRRRWIYEACLEALALRASEHTPRSPSAIPVED